MWCVPPPDPANTLRRVVYSRDQITNAQFVNQHITLRRLYRGPVQKGDRVGTVGDRSGLIAGIDNGALN